ncbi:MAG: SMP-30/gluconolactonase/LRE family protein [Alphaproteobacteria bacterium]|nr:MAG: SMP-30/gluconolactonase/LRE family protein [Alphaproteobacteria bacterium]
MRPMCRRWWKVQRQCSSPTWRIAASPKAGGCRCPSCVCKPRRLSELAARATEFPMQELATGYGLIEAPVWDPAHGLYFSDVLGGGIHLLDRKDKVSLAVPKRRGIGGMALHADGGLVAGGRDIVHVSLADHSMKVLLDRKAADDAVGFNDLTTDGTGRIYVGSIAFAIFKGEEMKPGNLYVIDLDGKARKISDGILLTNGLGFSPDGRLLYHSDARRELVRVYDVGDDGAVGHWRAFAAMGPGSVPDGLKVAVDGSVWVADAHGGRIAVFAADGRHLRDIQVPRPMVTSLCFGGDDLRDLYIVTGSRGGPSESCGTVYRMRSDVAGHPLPVARVRIER